MSEKLKYQQGDILLFAVGVLPEGCVKIEDNKGVLAEGEATGHLHRMAEPVEMFRGPKGPFPTSTDIYMRVPRRIDLLHTKGFGKGQADHFSEPIDAEVYNIGRVQEYDYIAQEARRVTD